MTRFSILICFLLCVVTLHAREYVNLTEDTHICGPKLTAQKLDGRVLAILNWGLGCGWCTKYLPEFNEVIDQYKKDPRVVILSSHTWGGTFPTIAKKLKEYNCDVPTYQNFYVVGHPAATAVPQAYVISIEGELLWKGQPRDGKLQGALRDALKNIPMPKKNGLTSKKSILTGLDTEIKHCSTLAKRLTIGQNIEPLLNQLKVQASRGGEVAAEANAILKHCTEWAKLQESSIYLDLNTHPSRAIANAKEYFITMPNRSKAIKKYLDNYLKDPQLSKLAAIRMQYNTLVTTDIQVQNRKRQVLAKAKKCQEQLKTLKFDKDDVDYLEVKTLLEDFIGKLED